MGLIATDFTRVNRLYPLHPRSMLCRVLALRKHKFNEEKFIA